MEDRECFVYDHFLPYDQKSLLGWEQISQFVEVKRNTIRKNYATREEHLCGERSFYLSTNSHDAGWYLEHIRAHWRIENTNHYIKDVSFGEDRSKIKIKPEVMTIIRSFAFNITKHTPQKEISTPQTLFATALSQASLLAYIAA